MNNKLPFIDGFAALTSFPPLPWQTALYEKFVSGDFPSACDLPTGLGKTSVIPIWLLALASKPQHVPRRLVYIVNRRTVVDQATTEAVELTKRLKSPGDSTALAELIARLKSLCGDAHDVPLAVSTLRGQFADNGEWAADPSRPAVLCGTVDMIGSRLLFSGYRCGFKRRPLHAGFLGQDALLVHDEAHLESPFQTLLTSIGREQERRGGALKPFRVLELSATPRTSGSVFKLTPEDNEHPVVRQRLDSVKQLRLHAIDDEKKTPDELAERALRHAESGDAVLVFAQSVETVDKVVERLKKDKRIGSERVAALTGTMRGLERDQLIDKDVFQRFLPPSDATNRAPQEGEKPAEKQTVYLVCTSAGEVGVNMSADHLVCDLTTYESMAQRFGRVNRFGKRNDSTIDVLHPSELPSEADLQKEMEKSEEKRDKYVVLNGHRRRTLDLLRELNGSASPASLAKLSSDTKINAFSPPRKVLPTSSILFDAWAMTTIHERFPGRPPIEEYLHGQSEYEPPRTSVAWRE
ncbi:MAG TPA: type I-U CRISPR-associated helicase/endonuclease Cas3, partial [Pirellulales bacterium]